MGYMKLEARLQLKSMHEKGMSIQAIAKELGVCRQTIYNELRRGTNGNGEYDPNYSECLFHKRQLTKGRTPILSIRQEVALHISNLILLEHRSPEQVVEMLKKEFPDEKSIPSSVNTIYAAIDKCLIPGVTRESLRSNKTKMFSGGMVCVPKWVRDQFGFCDGDVFSLDVQNDGTITFKKQDS